LRLWLFSSHRAARFDSHAPKNEFSGDICDYEKKLPTYYCLGAISAKKAFGFGAGAAE
jgi:hypothetical protein